MKILQISSSVLPISPNMKYGGIERVVRDLDKQYVAMGHESVVVAPGNSEIYGRLIPSVEQSVWKRDSGKSEYNTDNSALANGFEEHCKRCLDAILAEEPDAVHDHTKLVKSMAYAETLPNIPILTTMHGDLDDRSLSAIEAIDRVKRDGINYFNAISESQRRIFQQALWMDFSVPNALVTRDYPFGAGNKGYLFSIGKFDHNKGQDTAIKVAKQLGKKIILAGPVHNFRNHIRQYWEREVDPLIDESHSSGIPYEKIGSFLDNLENNPSQVIYVGEVDDLQKKAWFKNAEAFMMPIRWNEPFGLVMIEAMATGTPVIAYDKGAVSEIVRHGVTGYVVQPEDFDELVRATGKAKEIDPLECRRHVERNFDIALQAENYISIFNRIRSGR